MKQVGWMGLALGIVALAGLLNSEPGRAAEGVKVGFLTCNVSSGFGFIFGSSRDVNCTFSPSAGKAETYKGKINKFGVDIGYLNSAVMVWAVFAPTADAKPGNLAGEYVGATGSATVGVGVGANVLVGGSNKSFTLQPVSIEGNTGLNVAAGVAALTLEPVKRKSKAK
jgi:uncharacterized protein DUF992